MSRNFTPAVGPSSYPLPPLVHFCLIDLPILSFLWRYLLFYVWLFSLDMFSGFICIAENVSISFLFSWTFSLSVFFHVHFLGSGRIQGETECKILLSFDSPKDVAVSPFLSSVLVAFVLWSLVLSPPPYPNFFIHQMCGCIKHRWGKEQKYLPSGVSPLLEWFIELGSHVHSWPKYT